MAIKAGKKYHGTVGTGSQVIETQKGTLGYQVQLECEDGETEYVIWLTEKNIERARKTFIEALGVPAAKLEDENYVDLQMSNDLAGREVTFVTEEEEYKGKTRIKVAFLFKRNMSSVGSPAKAVALFFKGGVLPAAKSGDPITDDDIPF